MISRNQREGLYAGKWKGCHHRSCTLGLRHLQKIYAQPAHRELTDLEVSVLWSKFNLTWGDFKYD